MIGRTVSHYRVTEKLGEGGMGVVYRAEDTLLGRDVAVKFLPPTGDAEKFRARFLREARAASSLSHENIATVHDYGETPEGEPFIVMELVEGRTLDELLRSDAPPDLRRATKIVERVGRALAEAHRRGIVHRDIKPANVIVGERGQVKVLDFGLAKQSPVALASAARPEAATLIGTRTAENVVLGTPLYLSPEQATPGHPVDARSDLFSLGAVLYEALAGRPPFGGGSVLEIFRQVETFDPDPPSKFNPQVTPALDRVTLKALAKRPEDRYQSADEFITDLRHVANALAQGSRAHTRLAPRQRGTSPLSHALKTLRQRRTPPALLALLAVALAGALLWRSAPPRPDPVADKKYQEGMRALRDGTYYRASKSLEDAIRIDDRFALAHAAYAEALMELDYSRRAMAELLTAQDRARKQSTLLQHLRRSTDRLYLDAIDATIRRDFRAAADAYAEIARRRPEESYAYVDLGRAYEKNEEFDRAIESYQKAAALDQTNASAFLRLATLYGRRAEADDLRRAEEAFDTAERLYDRQSNDEGAAEVRYRRGELYNTLNRLEDARRQLEQVLRTPHANEYQQVKALLQLSSVFCTRGETAAAVSYADQALARAEGMENLKASGLIDLGNAFFYRGPQYYGEAEKYFQRALGYAAGNGQRTEMRARLMLSNLRIQQGQPEAAFSFIEPALKFYVAGRYRKESLLAWNLLGRAHSQKGDYAAAERAYEQALQIPEQVDPSQVALAHSDLGNLLASREQFPQALRHYADSHRINKSLGARLQAGYDLLSLGNVRWMLGDYDGAERALGELEASLQSDASFSELKAWLPLVRAHLALSRRRPPEAAGLARAALDAAGTNYKTVALQATYVLGLAKALAGGGREGVALCEGVVREARGAPGPQTLAQALLAHSEAALEAGDARAALASASEAVREFGRAAQQSSEWRAASIAALAARLMNDAPNAAAHAARAASVESGLRQAWGEEAFAKYLTRPDVQYYRERLARALQ